MSKPENKGIKRVILALGYSWKGLKAVWQDEEAFRQELILCAVLLPIGLWIGQTGLERALLVFSVLLVPLVELLNSAIEAVVDRFGGEQHPLSGRAKDIGSAAVLISILIAALVWLLVLID